MPRHTEPGRIPACHVRRDLLLQLEKYLLQSATDIEGLTADRRMRFYSINLTDANGADTTFRGMEELPLTNMPNNLRTIKIWLRNSEHYDFDLTFSTSPPIFKSGSCYDLMVDSPTAVETVAGMRRQIDALIDRFRYHGLVRRPGLPIEGAMLLVAALAFSFAFAFVTGDKQTGGVFLLVFLGLWMLLFHFLSNFPHCIFDSEANRTRLDRTTRVVWIIGGFLIGTVVLGTAWEQVKARIIPKPPEQQQPTNP
jgi:hypothetical protein